MLQSLAVTRLSSESDGGVRRASAKIMSAERSLLNQGFLGGSPTGSRVVATRSFGSFSRPVLKEAGLTSAESSPTHPDRARLARPTMTRRDKEKRMGLKIREETRKIMLFCPRSWHAQGESPAAASTRAGLR